MLSPSPSERHSRELPSPVLTRLMLVAFLGAAGISCEKPPAPRGSQAGARPAASPQVVRPTASQPAPRPAPLLHALTSADIVSNVMNKNVPTDKAVYFPSDVSPEMMTQLTQRLDDVIRVLNLYNPDVAVVHQKTRIEYFIVPDVKKVYEEALTGGMLPSRSKALDENDVHTYAVRMEVDNDQVVLKILIDRFLLDYDVLLLDGVLHEYCHLLLHAQGQRFANETVEENAVLDEAISRMQAMAKKMHSEGNDALANQLDAILKIYQEIRK